jgi:hypothetical protein
VDTLGADLIVLVVLVAELAERYLWVTSSFVEDMARDMPQPRPLFDLVGGPAELPGDGFV